MKQKALLVGFVALVGALLAAIAYVAWPSSRTTRAKARAEGPGETRASDEAPAAEATPPSRRSAPLARTGEAPSPGPSARSHADGRAEGCAFTLCGTACIATREDSSNCGACGNACGPSSWCNHGVCVVDRCKTGEGEAECRGTCKNLLSDPLNCGECGNACGPGQTCKDAQCDPPASVDGGSAGHGPARHDAAAP